MAPAPDTKSAQPNIQDVFLNYVRREKLMDHGGADHMIFKHAIAAIRTPKAAPNYFSHP